MWDKFKWTTMHYFSSMRKSIALLINLHEVTASIILVIIIKQNTTHHSKCTGKRWWPISTCPAPFNLQTKIFLCPLHTFPPETAVAQEYGYLYLVVPAEGMHMKRAFRGWLSPSWDPAAARHGERAAVRCDAESERALTEGTAHRCSRVRGRNRGKVNPLNY